MERLWKECGVAAENQKTPRDVSPLNFLLSPRPATKEKMAERTRSQCNNGEG